MSSSSDDELLQKLGVMLDEPEGDLCDICEQVVTPACRSKYLLFGCKHLDKGCFSALKALQRLTQKNTDMKRRVDMCVRNDMEKFKCIALSLRTDQERTRSSRQRDETVEYITTMIKVTVVRRVSGVVLLNEREFVAYHKHWFGATKEKALEQWASSMKSPHVHREQEDGVWYVAVKKPTEILNEEAVGTEEKFISTKRRLDKSAAKAHLAKKDRSGDVIGAEGSGLGTAALGKKAAVPASACLSDASGSDEDTQSRPPKKARSTGGPSKLSRSRDNDPDAAIECPDGKSSRHGKSSRKSTAGDKDQDIDSVSDKEDKEDDAEYPDWCGGGLAAFYDFRLAFGTKFRKHLQSLGFAADTVFKKPDAAWLKVKDLEDAKDCEYQQKRDAFSEARDKLKKCPGKIQAWKIKDNIQLQRQGVLDMIEDCKQAHVEFLDSIEAMKKVNAERMKVIAKQSRAIKNSYDKLTDAMVENGVNKQLAKYLAKQICHATDKQEKDYARKDVMSLQAAIDPKQRRVLLGVRLGLGFALEIGFRPTLRTWAWIRVKARVRNSLRTKARTEIRARTPQVHWY